MVKLHSKSGSLWIVSQVQMLMEAFPEATALAHAQASNSASLLAYQRTFVLGELIINMAGRCNHTTSHQALLHRVSANKNKQCDSVEANRSADLVPQCSDSLHCCNLLERDGEGVSCVPVWVGPYQAADLHQHLINCMEGTVFYYLSLFKIKNTVKR